ncbi:MAG: hemolysin family protein [Alphaproteobacteria bacterium]
MAASETRHAQDNDRGILSEIGAKIAEALRGLKTGASMRERLEEVIEESAGQAQDLRPQERLMLANLLKFGALKVGDVMVPRADIVAVEQQVELDELVRVFRDAQHSRLPIYRETLDDPVGMVHIKDVLRLAETGADGRLRWPQAPLASLRRDVLFVPPAMPTLDLLLKMQTTRIHLALVVDEYGGTDGLVSIEDLVERIVGDIEDEHDTEPEPEMAVRPDGSWEADARVPLEQFREQAGILLAPDNEEEEVNTLGGLVAAMLGRVPARGEIVSHPAGIEFEVLEADPRRVKKLRIRPIAARAAAAR